MKKIASVIAAIMVFALMISGCNNKTVQSGQQETETSVLVGSTPDTGKKDDNVFTINTKYGDLKFPTKWKDDVEVKISEEEPYTVSFTSRENGERIFSLHFGKGEGYLLGTLNSNDEQIKVFVDNAELDAKAKDYDKLCEIQEDVNVILNHLTEDYDFKPAVQNIPTEENTEVYEIKTTIATFCYPTRWKDRISVKDEDGTVSFFSDDVDVFELKLGGTDGFSVGTYDGKDLRLVTFAFTQYKDDQKRFEELCQMQEDVNVLLDHLDRDKAFIRA